MCIRDRQVTLQTPSAATTDFSVPNNIGTELRFELSASDGKEWSEPDEVVVTIVDNSAPVADAGEDITANEFSQVTITGTGTDSDIGDTLTYQWTQISGVGVNYIANGSTLTFTAPATEAGGQTLQFELVVTDDDALNPKSSAPDTVTVNLLCLLYTSDAADE